MSPWLNAIRARELLGMNVRESRNVGAVSAKVWHKVSKRRPWILRSTSSWAPHPCRVKESLCASATLTSLTLQTVCSTKSIEPSKLNEQLQLVEIFWIQPGHWEQCKDWYTCQLKAPNVFFSKETHHLLHTLSIKKRSSKFLKCITDHEHPWQHTYLGYPKDLKILWPGILNLSRPACLMVN